MDRLKSFLSSRYTLAYSSAILLHLLFFLFYVPLKHALIYAGPDVPRPAEPEPLTFEFVEARNPANEVPPDETPFLSDRQSLAKDHLEKVLPVSAILYSEGLSDSRDTATSPPLDGSPGSRGGGKLEEGADASTSEEKPNEERPDARNKTSLRRLRSGGQGSDPIFGTPAVLSMVQLDHRESSALAPGDIQLSTYNWEWGPYVAAMLQRIRRHIAPPVAFSQYGMIQGKTHVRFRIFRDGRVEALQVVKTEGSELLRDTSTRAVSLSADFKPLPEHFPEEHLEVDILFTYSVLNGP